MRDAAVAKLAEEDVGLGDLLSGIFHYKTMILAIAALGFFVAIAYGFIAKPVYEAKIFLLPPTKNDISGLNLGRTHEFELTPYNVSQVYDSFIYALRSEALRRRFFEEVYLPSIGEGIEYGAKAELYQGFSKVIYLVPGTKDVPGRYTLVAANEQPAEAVAWGRQYVDWASKLAVEELVKDSEREVDVLASGLDRKIATLRDSGQKLREDSIAQLREALRVAQAIGLEKPPIITGNEFNESSATMSGDLKYMRGSKALEAEIKNLESRSSNDPFIDKLRDLQARYMFYKGLDASSSGVSVYRLDGAIEQPVSPVQPKKALLAVLGLVFGLLAGIVAALVVWMSRRQAS